ncbi:UBP-type zinc finger domain-containing protein [Salipiger sp. H15]|uniref:UBP-type zinc finger domain-containing protein n=1 Tax=Alloyangia sp. H15 TaxID=3029062 RepID=A0AAU8APP8_9RHOB
MSCAHLDQILQDLPTEEAKRGAVCPACVAMGSGWLHLRVCRSCGHVGCCDSSPNRHARGHWEATGHAVIASFEPRERWSWCFADDLLL